MKKHLFNYFPKIILLLSVISIFLFKITYISISLSIISLILSIIFSKKQLKILIITTITSSIIITLNILVIINNYQKKIDVFKDENILIGTWLYNENGGTYIFNDDYSYIQYTNSDTTNNYCQGTYNYSYGLTTDKGIKLRQDENYYYYDLEINEKECYIMNKKTYDNYTKKMYFAINKYTDKDKILFANIETENIFTLTKQK